MTAAAKQLLSEEELDQQAEQELLDEARDVIEGLELRLQELRTGSLDAEEAARLLKQDISNLRLKCRSVAVPGLGALTHRLDDYLSNLSTIELQHIGDLQTFGDRIGRLLDGEEVGEAEIAAVVRDLPANTGFDVGEVTITDVEATLIVPQRSAARVVARELAACGYRVSTVLDPIEALELILETRPDFVITSMVMPRRHAGDQDHPRGIADQSGAGPPGPGAVAHEHRADPARPPVRRRPGRRAAALRHHLSALFHRPWYPSYKPGS
jgi:hypothetical protein